MQVVESSIEDIEFAERAKTFVDMYKEFEGVDEQQEMDVGQLDEVEKEIE